MDLETSDIYTPRVDIESIPLDATKEEIAKMFLDTGFSRLPVYEEDIDHIVGIVNQKDFHNFIYHTDRPLKDIIRPVLFITPTMKIGVLLKKLQDSKPTLRLFWMNLAERKVWLRLKISSKSWSVISGMSMTVSSKKSRKFPTGNI